VQIGKSPGQTPNSSNYLSRLNYRSCFEMSQSLSDIYSQSKNPCDQQCSVALCFFIVRILMCFTLQFINHNTILHLLNCSLDTFTQII